MKILIAGLGSIGRRHLRHLVALRPEFPEEINIRLLRRRRSTEPDEELDGFPVETRHTFALAWRPDAVIVATPTALHLDMAIPAAEAGCHILLEKPISHNLDRLDELEASIRRRGGQILVGYQFRFHPGLRKVHDLLEEGAIGRPLSVRAHWGEWLPGWHPEEDYRQGYSARSDLGGGVILTLSHPLDYLRWLFGEVSAVSALTGKLSDLELDVDDTAEIALHFASGVIGSLHLNYTQRPPSHYLEVIGTQGTIRWDNADGIVHLYNIPTEAREMDSTLLADQAEGTKVFPSSDLQHSTFPPPKNFNRDSLFKAEMRHFLELIRGRATPVCRLEDGWRALELALAAQQSQKEGSVVNLENGRLVPVAEARAEETS